MTSLEKNFHKKRQRLQKVQTCQNMSKPNFLGGISRYHHLEISPKGELNSTMYYYVLSTPAWMALVDSKMQ